MPRKARIDAPGALHHVIARGIDRRSIFEDDIDRDDFLKRIDTILSGTQTACYAWALIPNHFHLLIRTGPNSISTAMRRLLTGYAISYNYRHRRHGHLFQNRYKSILCQEDTYLLELVRYIHLNPLRAGIVRDIGRLHRYPYCGHSVLLGKYDRDWQDTDYVLRLFDNTVSGEYDLKAKGYDFEAVVERVAELLEMKANQVLTNRKNKQAVRARSLVCFWAFSELGINQIELAQRFGISQPAVSSAVRKGEEIARTNDYELLKNRKL